MSLLRFEPQLSCFGSYYMVHHHTLSCWLTLFNSVNRICTLLSYNKERTILLKKFHIQLRYVFFWLYVLYSTLFSYGRNTSPKHTTDSYTYHNISNIFFFTCTHSTGLQNAIMMYLPIKDFLTGWMNGCLGFWQNSGWKNDPIVTVPAGIWSITVRNWRTFWRISGPWSSGINLGVSPVNMKYWYRSLSWKWPPITNLTTDKLYQMASAVLCGLLVLPYSSQ